MSRAGRTTLLALIGLAVFLPALSARDLWNPDEPRYAEVAREMRLLDDFLLPHLNSEVYSEKPPLFFWLAALGQGAGAGPGAGRLVSALALLGCMLLIESLGRHWFSPRAGLLAALAFITTGLVAWIGRMGVLDPLLTFWALLAVYGFCRGLYPLLYLGLGLGVLTKGPVVILIVALAGVAWMLATPRDRWKVPRHLLWGIPFFLAIVAAWLIPACIAGGRSYAETILFKQTVGRMHSSWSHQRPFWYYLPTLPLFLFPWIFFVPRGAIWALKQGRTRPGPRMLVLWFGLGLLVFSLVSGKRDRYLLPFYPALALLVGAYLDALLARTGPEGGPPVLRRLLRGQHWVLLVLGLGFVAFALGGEPLLDRFAAKEPFILGAALPLTRFPGSLGLIAGGGLLAVLAGNGLRRAPRASLSLVFVATFALLATFDFVLTPRIDTFKSPRPVAQRFAALAPEGAAALFPNDFAGSYNLYARRAHFPILSTREELEEFLARPGRRGALTSREHIGRYHLDERPLPGMTRTVLGRVGHRIMVLLANFRPD